MNHFEALVLTIAIIVTMLVVRLLRSIREQRFGLVTMWVIPVLFAGYTAWVMVSDAVTTPTDVALALLALAIGGSIGWYQGTHTTIRFDRAARAMFVKMSPLGAAIFIGVVTLRIGIRMLFSGPTPGAYQPGGPLNTLSILLLVVGVGVIAGLRAYLTQAYRQAPIAID